MLTLRKAQDRGHFQNGWLSSHHTFSFSEYHDPRYMGVSTLRVINDDTVAPAGGFDTHGHRDMEIVSYVLEGELAHRDSIGNGSTIKPGDIQRMSAGSGIRHSEFNASDTYPVHFLQIWLLPTETGIAPGYEQKHFSAADRDNRWAVLASPDGREDSVHINSDALMYGSVLSAGASISHALPAGRIGYLHVAKGSLQSAGETLLAGDGAKISAGAVIDITTDADAEVLLFDLPA